MRNYVWLGSLVIVALILPATGVDGIPADLIRASGLNAVEALYRLTVKIWRDCSWPDIWKIQEIVLLHKGGSPNDCSNYRTIALISHSSKILLIILLNRIRQKFENELPDEQAGCWVQTWTRHSWHAMLHPERHWEDASNEWTNIYCFHWL